MAKKSDIVQGIRLNLADVRYDLAVLESAWKVAGKNIVEQLAKNGGSLDATLKMMMSNIRLMGERASKGLAPVIKFEKEWANLRTLFANLVKSDPTNKFYQETLDILTDLIGRQDTYHDRAKKLAETKKENAEAEKKQLEEAEEAEENSWANRIKAIAGGITAYTLVRKAMQLVVLTLEEMIRVTEEYEQSLANTQSVMQATTRDLRAMDTAARNAGETTRFTATEAASALYFMASAGLTASESVETLAGTLAMAQATGKSLQDTAQMMTVTLAQFNLKASESSRVANALTAGITSSQATMDKYKTSLYQIGPVASGMGRELEEVIGVLDVMYDSGMQASRSGRAMRNALAELANENSNTVRKLKGMGIAFKDIDVSSNTLVESFGTLNEAGLSTGQIMEAFGKVIGPQMQVLIRTSREELARYTDEVKNTNKAYLAAHIQNDTLQGDTYRMKSAFEALGITLGNTVLPAFRAGIQAIFTSTRTVNKWIKTLIGSRTSANAMSESLTRVNEHMDEYTRMTTLLNDKTIELTRSEQILYEQRRRNSLQQTLQELSLLSKSYEKTLKQEEELRVVSSYAGAVRDKTLAWRKMLDLVGEVKEQEGEATEAQSASLRTLTKEINELTIKVLEDEAKLNARGFGKTLGREAQGQIDKAKASAEQLYGVSLSFGDVLNGTWETMTRLAQGTYTGLSKNFDERLLAISENANNADVALQALIETKEITVAEAGRAYAEEILTEKHLIGMNEKLVASIKAEAEAYNLAKSAQDDKSTITYAEYLTTKDMLDVTTKLTAQIQGKTSAQYSDAVSSALSSKNTNLMALGYKEAEKAIQAEVDALQASIDAQAEANQLIVDESQNIDGASKAILESIIAQQKKNEEDKLALAHTQAMRKLMEEKALAGEEYDIAELDRLVALEARYAFAIDQSTEWSEALRKAHYDVRQTAIDTAYAEAKTVEAFDEAYKMKLALLADYQKDEEASIDKNAKVKADAMRTTSAQEISKLQETSRKELEIQRKLGANAIVEAEKAHVERSTADATASTERLAMLKAEYDEQMGLNIGSVTAQERIKDKYEKDYDRELVRRNKFVKDSLIQRDAEIEAQTEITQTALKALEAEHTAKVIEEQQRLKDWIDLNDQLTLEEKSRLYAYYNIQEDIANGVKEGNFLKEMQRQAELMAKWLERDAVNQAYIDMLDKQALSAQEAQIAELKRIGDVSGALAVLGEVYDKQEKDKKKEAKATYEAQQKILDATEYDDVTRKAEQEKLDKEYQQALTDITTYYSGERNKLSKEYTEDEEERIYALQKAWEGVIGGFDKYTDALRKAQEGTVSREIDALVDEGKFDEALAMQKEFNAEQSRLTIEAINNQKAEEIASLEEKKLSEDEYETQRKAIILAAGNAITAEKARLTIEQSELDIEYAKKVDDYEQKLTDEELKRINTVLSAWQSLYSTYDSLAKGLASDERKRREAEVKELLDTHQYEEALALQEQLNLEAHEQRKKDVEQSFADERSAFSAKIDGDAELQAEYNDFVIKSAQQEKEVLDALDKGYLIDKDKVIREYGDKSDEYAQELADEELKRINTVLSAWQSLYSTYDSLAEGLASDERKRREAEVKELLDTHQYEEALALQEQLNLEAHEQRKKDVEQSFADERSAFSAKIDGDAELQAEYNDFVIKSAQQEKEVLDALDKGYLIDKDKVIKDYGEKSDEYSQELTDKELKRQEELKSGWEELAGKVRGYADALRSAQDAQTEAEIGTLLGKGQFDQAYALQEQLDKESHQRSLAGLYQYTNERKEANQKAYDEGTRSLEDYNKENELITETRLTSLGMLNEIARLKDLDRDEEYFELKKKFWTQFGYDLADGVLNSMQAVGSVIQAFYDRQLSAMELVQQRLLKDIEDRLEAELEANGVANEDAVDKARKALEVAKATADEAGIIEAEKALKKAEIEKKYADEKLKAEQDYAWKVAQIEYASASTAWKLDMASTASSAALAIARAVGSAPWPSNIPAITFATGMGIAQVASQSMAKPVEPVQADYYASGGIIAGTKDGTPIIAGERNRTEAIFNQSQMANLLMAIGNGKMGVGGGTTIELVVQDMDKNEIARHTVEALNGSRFLLDPNRALKKVATR